MNCDTWQDRIDAFVDGELTNGETLAFEEHLRSCPGCSAEALARQRLKIETRIAGQRYTPSVELRERIQQQVSTRRSRAPWLLSLAGVAAVVALMFVSGALLRQNQSKNQLVGQLVDLHVSVLSSNAPLDVAGSDEQNVKPWFSSRVPFSVDVPELDGTPYKLIGANLTYIQQAPAAQLIFTARKHRVSVFMFRDHGDTAALGNENTPVRRSGYASQTWVEDGVRYFAISDADPQDVHNLCELLKKADQS